MKISVFGLGYVGAVSAACLADQGHEVIGVDPIQTKLDILNSGASPIVERGLEGIIRSNVSAGRLRAISDHLSAVQQTDLTLVCVGTPSQANGNLDLRAIRAVCEQIGVALAEKRDRHTVAIRSTMLPGSMNGVVIKTIESASGKSAGRDFGVCFHPEFLREGTAVEDFRSPPKTVIGEMDSDSGDPVAALYGSLTAPLLRTSIEVAEMVKYADNVWHALKVSFANEIGDVCKGVGIDGHAVMDIFCRDTKLNISPTYLKPGFAFGGSCLPKDCRALGYKAKMIDLDLPVLKAILASNDMQIARAFEMVRRKHSRKVSFLGLSFKSDTDDLRESPLVELAERLIGKGYELRIYDRNVNLAKITGANREYILNHIPHIGALLMPTIDDALLEARTVLVGNKDPEFVTALRNRPEIGDIIDLVRLPDDLHSRAGYDGICW
jgi:GDP-mannose 6-dehydrogenase